MAGKEKKLTNQILLKIGSNVKLFRNNVAFSWQGKKISDRNTKIGRVIELNNPRPIHSGLTTGASDLIGWTSVEVTPDMVGKKVAIFTAIEAKTPGIRTTDDQKNFIRVLSEDGGYAGVAKEVEDAQKIVGNTETIEDEQPKINRPAKVGAQAGKRRRSTRRKTPPKGE